MAYRFYPTETFLAVVHGRENKYVKGAGYTVRDTPLHQKKLHPLVQEWAAAGKVVIGEAPQGGIAGAVDTNKEG